jgi:NAD(P) transhydrogenase
MTMLSADAVVIGSGPGGEGAAMQLAKSGRRVVLVEKYARIGGGCTHWATIPSKALRATINQLTDAVHHPLLQSAGLPTQWTMPEMLQRARAVIAQQENLRQHYYQRNQVAIVHGHARLTSPQTVAVEGGPDIETSSIIIATGSRPYRPVDVDFSHPRVFDSDKILSLVEQPRTMTVYGAGIVGCEYASMFRNLDVKINLVNSRARLLDFLDDEISDALSYHFRERGMVIRHNESYERIEPVDDGVILHLASGKHLKTDILLWAVGRTGNSHDMGLEDLGINPDGRGYLAVNEQFQTAVPNIYAVGDVIGIPSLASAAFTQGRAAAMAILGSPRPRIDNAMIPSGIYTSPEISSIGRTERDLTEAKIPYEVGQAQFRNLARAQISGQTTGVLKILFHRESRELLGIHCFGANASEIIHIGQAIMAQPAPHNTLDFFLNNTFNYPTMAEAYRVAALNGYNRLF